ncbi:Extracellular Matrix protein PelE [hydrothermal vent metagenome]|uniref:Extracellular Matrix protein PelE n=1 Tax=hydrothermal vent metagenome TaxID=652676 RepID=A0A1W1BK12_9ZZZZ
MMSWDYSDIFVSLPIFYIVHAVVSLVISLISSYVLQRRFKNDRFKITLFFWIFNMSLPLIGYLMSLWLVYYLVSVEYEKQLTNIHSINMIDFENEFPEVSRLFGEAAMEKLLSEDMPSLSSMKMKALVSLSDNASKTDVTLIKSSLSDRNDEVRLYSFAVIDKLERGINGQIHEKLKLYTDAESTEERVARAEELAHLYWDLVYFELADENLKKFIISEVEKYAKVVLDVEPDNQKINILLGKTYLMSKEIDEAESCFKNVVENGKNIDFIVPYLAEILFLKRSFAEVKKLFANARGLKTNTLLYPVVEQWSGR